MEEYTNSFLPSKQLSDEFDGFWSQRSTFSWPGNTNGQGKMQEAQEVVENQYHHQYQ